MIFTVSNNTSIFALGIMLLLRATLSCPTLLPLKIKAAKVLIILGIAKKMAEKMLADNQ